MRHPRPWVDGTFRDTANMNKQKNANMPAKLSKLVCGNVPAQNVPGACELSEILTHLGKSLERLGSEIRDLNEDDDSRVAVIGPFLGRSLLEIAVTALIGRLDPMRVFVVRRVQQQPSYSTGEVWKSAIRWNGDVVAEKVGQPWDAKHEYRGMTKALLGDYYDELLWKPAVARVLDLPIPDEAGAWFSQLKATDEAGFLPRRRIEIGALYTSLSKGVHHEFVMPPGAIYDRKTVADLMQRSVQVVAELAFVSHFIPHSPYCLESNQAIAELKELEAIEVMK